MKSSDEFEKYDLINSVVSPEDVFDFIGAEIAKDGGHNFTYICPYHDDYLPSLNVDKTTGSFNCFGCDNKGRGAYKAAKHYILMTEDRNPSAIEVVDFLKQINPSIERYRHLFTVKQQKPYEKFENKKEKFRNRSKSASSSSILTARLGSLSLESKAKYIDAVMNNLPDDLILRIVDPTAHKKAEEDLTAFMNLVKEVE